MKLIDGKAIADQILQQIRKEVAALKGRKPCIAFILVGDNSASKTYVRSKKRACAYCGIQSLDFEFAASISQRELTEKIKQLNGDQAVDGILVQLPLPPHIDEMAVTLSIDPAKDADGFHPLNVGKMLLGHPSLLPCTPHGIQMLLEKSKIEVEGKHVVIIGRSNIVGKPLAAILMQKKKGCNATVTVCHSQTHSLHALTKTADILVAATGKPQWIDAKMVKKGAVVIDVGINRIHGKIVGDVDFDSVAPLSSAITPVPGGVGPMTIAMLLQNTFHCYKATHDPHSDL